MRTTRDHLSRRTLASVVATLLATSLLASSAIALGATGGVGTDAGATSSKPQKAKLKNGKAIAPSNAPARIRRAIAAGNEIRNKPYVWGGGHGKWKDSGYDCSGTVSYILHAAGMLNSPRDSGQLRKWGHKGRGQWITVAANGGHTYIVVAGLRMDTSGTGGNGPRWHGSDIYTRTNGPFAIRHYSSAY
ncbi:MAG: hypothetical protein QOG26_52 [Solirubrobacterales bacterium]|nr:hypothetical protein [Solirubrobacterales bacterium]